MTKTRSLITLKFTQMKIYNIDRETELGCNKYQQLLKCDSWLFQAVEKEFDNWMDDEIERGSDTEDIYFSDEAVCNKKGAIQDAIEQIFDVMDEYKLPFIYLNDMRLDLAAAFQY